jgi:hypothetical protein
MNVGVPHSTWKSISGLSAAGHAGEPELDHRVVVGGAVRRAEGDRRAREGGGLLPETFLGDELGRPSREGAHDRILRSAPRRHQQEQARARPPPALRDRGRSF